MRPRLYCEECGSRLTLYVVGVCPRCEYDLTGGDEGRDARIAAWGDLAGNYLDQP